MTDLPVYHVEIKLHGHVVIALSVPDLDCVRVPGVYRGAEPQPVRWVNHAVRMWRADYSAVVGTPDNFRAERFELTARRVS
jgi:hypothetical protein